MQRDANTKAPAVRDRSRPDNQRRRQSNLTPNPRSFVSPTLPQLPPGYIQSHPPGSPSGPHIPAGVRHGGSNYHYGPATPYSQPPGGFYGQYTIPTPPTLNAAHGLPYHYPHTFGNIPGDNPLGQGNYPQLLQSSGQSYQYPPGDSTSPNPPYVTPPHTAPYPSHPPPINPNPQPGAMSSSYPGGHFSSMGYPSPMGSPPYAYPHQYTPPASVYGAYGALPYPHPLSSPLPDGVWYFVGHGTAPPQQHQYEDEQQLEEGHEPQYPSLNQGSRATNSQPSSSHRPRPPIRASSGPVVSQKSDTTPLSTASVGPDSNPRVPSTPPPLSASSKPLLRREWHPRPPPQRSPWVMWVGNVPSDATQEELWTFLSNASHRDASPGFSGVVSIFLIARSSCAFVNYASEGGLERAISFFNGLPLRPNDPQCPKLVCKVRKSTDDLKSGVGGQRGIGLHKQWVKDQRKLQNQQDDRSHGPPDGSLSAGRSSPEDFTGRQIPEHSSSSESYASTTSSLLGEHFPTRYFILKSLSDVGLSYS